MKKINIFALILFITFITSSILTAVTYSYTGGIVATNLLTEEREIATFDKVTLMGAGELHITHGNETKLVVETSEEYLPMITTEIDHGTLILNEDDWSRVGINLGFLGTKRIIKYNLTVTDLDEVNLEGFGSIYVDEIIAESVTINLIGAGSIEIGDIKATGVTLNMEGLGDLNIQTLNANDINTSLEGAGSINISSGTVMSQIIEINGLGSYEAEDLKSDITEATLDGAGSIDISVSNLLTADLDGLGSISYWGQPEVISNIDGLGSISKH